MNEKFMHLKKLILPTISILVITSQICGCASVNSKEAMDMIRNNESIEITVAEPISVEQGKEVVIPWTELAYLETYEELRKEIDDILYIIPMQDGKNGVIYVDEEGNHSNNTTLKDAFNNKKFTEDFWNNTEVSQKVIESSKKEFADVETDQEALLAAYNAYYNLLSDGADPSSANMQSTLTRLEAMSLLFKADTPVDHTLQLSKEYESLLGESEEEGVTNPDLALFAEQIDKAGNSYLTLSNNSLDKSTATGTMTRAEFIYMIVQRYYSNDYNALTDTDIKNASKTLPYEDITNGGNVAKKQNYITTEKNPDTGKKEEKPLARYQAYELNYCLQNPDKGLTEPLYKAYIVANNKGILGTDTDTNWDIGLTKEYALEVLTNTLEQIGNKVKYDRGESHGESVAKDTTSTNETVAEESSNGQLDITEEALTPEDEANKYYMKVNPDGSREYSPQLVTDVMGNEWFSGYSEEEVIFFLERYFMQDSTLTDSYIREMLSMMTQKDVEVIMKKLPKNQSTTSTASNTKTESSSNTQSNTQQSTPSSQETTPSQPSSQQQTVGDTGLTQEQMDAIKAENEAAGWTMEEHADVGEDTGEHFGGRQFN